MELFWNYTLILKRLDNVYILLLLNILSIPFSKVSKNQDKAHGKKDLSVEGGDFLSTCFQTL
jgi:hypothetical protein